MVKIIHLTKLGHETSILDVEDAERLILGEVEKAFVVDWDTKEILKELKLKPNQTIAILPKVAGG